MLFSASIKLLRNWYLILLASCFFSLVRADDSEVIGQKQHRLMERPAVVIDVKTQANSGLKTTKAELAERHTEFVAIGKIINVQPLLALRERYLIAQAELEAAKSRLKQTKLSLERQQALFRHGILARRSVQEQQALGFQDKALADAGNVRLTAITQEARLLWGKELAEWALSNGGSRLKEIISGKRQLLQVTLPAGKQLGSQVATIAIEPNGDRSKARAAALLSRSTQVDGSTQGASYFFQVSAEGLPIGTKVSAWIPETSQSQIGVIVPDAALIWHRDQIYAYIKVRDDAFERRLIKHYSVIPEGYFVDEGVGADEEVVVTGAQMLLSEELRGQIPDED